MRLGAIYQYLSVNRDLRGLPLDEKSIPTIVSKPPAAVLVAMGEIYGTDGEINRKFDRGLYRGTKIAPSKPALYKQDYTAIIPRIHRAAIDFAIQSLEKEELALGNLRLRVELEQGLAEALHSLAVDIAKEGNGFEPTDKEDSSYDTVIPATTRPEWNFKTRRLEQVPSGYEQKRDLNYVKLRFAIRSRYAPLVHAKKNAVLSTLYLDPRSLEILEKFADSAEAGKRIAVARLIGAQAAIFDFRQQLTDPVNLNHIWRYEMFVRGGIRNLGLQDVTGLNNFVLQVGKVLGNNSVAGWINFASVAVGCLGLVFAGPVGLAVVAAADFSLATASASLAFLREHEQELASRGSALRSDENKFSAAPDYAETRLAAAAALLSGLAFFHLLRPLRDLLRGETGAAKTLTVAPKEPSVVETKTPKPDLTEPLNKKVSEEVASTASDVRGLMDEAIENKPIVDSERGIGESTKGPVSDALRLEDNKPPASTKISRPSDEVIPIVDPERGVGESSRGTTKRGEPRVKDSDPYEVNQKIREERKEEIRKSIKDIQDDYDKTKAQMSSVDAKIKLARKQMTEAWKRGDTMRLKTVRERLQILTDERPTLGTLGVDLRRMEDLLKGTEADYYDWLSRKASRESEYTSVSAGIPDARFKMDGVTDFEVEHGMPRSKIFALPGFERLKVVQQSRIFSYRDNISKIPGGANSARGNRAYADLPSNFITRWFKDKKSWQAAVDNEAKMEREITAMVKNPSLIPEPGKKSWFRIKEESEALGHKFAAVPETPLDPVSVNSQKSLSPVSSVSDPRLIDDASRGLSNVMAPSAGK